MTKLEYSKEDIIEMQNVIDELQQENELLKHKISVVEELNIELQCRVKCNEESRNINERTIDFQKQAIEKYEKMFNYLTGGNNE